MKVTEEAIKQLIDIIKDSKEFILAQAPDVVKQIIEWKLWENHYLLWVGVVLIILGIIAILIANSYNYGDGFVWGIFGIIFLLIGMLTAICSYGDLNQIKIAPKVFLLEYLTSMVKQ